MQRKNKKQKKLIRILGIFIIIVLLGFLYITLANNLTKNPTIIIEVNASDDDSRTFLSGQGYGDEDGQWATLQLSPPYSFGTRFINLSIPHNAIIIDAYIELYSIGTPGHQYPNCKIYCDNVDDAVNFSNIGVLDICGRSYTHNYIRWNATAPYGKWIKTPSLVTPLQEIINRKNWTDGNAVAFLFISEGLRGYSATFQNYESGYPAKLYVEWKETC